MSVTDRHLALDAGNTRIAFDVRWFGVLPIRGGFSRVHGALIVGNGNGGAPDVEVRLDVDAASVDTGNALRDRHLRAPRFLHADLHPYISFRSQRIRREAGQLVVDGVLALRGVETPITATCPIDELSDEGGTVQLCGRFTVSRRRFDIGVPRGIGAMNPLFPAIADLVRVSVQLMVPAERIGPVLRAAAGR